MRRCILVIMVMALTLTPSWGEERVVPVVFEVYPHGTNIWLELQGQEPILLGTSSREPVQVDLSLFQGQETYRLRYEKEGHLPAFDLLTQKETRDDIRELEVYGEWPRTDPRKLTPSVTEVEFLTVPRQAAVYIAGEDRPLGLSNELVKLDRARFVDQATGGDRSFDVTFKLDGHLPETVTVVPEVWTTLRWPPDGAVKLRAKSFDVAAQYWARDNSTAFTMVVVSLLLLVGAGGVHLGVRRARGQRERQRNEKLRELTRRKEAADDPYLGEKLGRYRLVESLDNQDAYRAVPDSTMNDEEQVFLRVLPIPEEDSAETRRVLEIRVDQMRGHLDHPTLIRLVDWGEKEDFLYLVTEWVDGDQIELPNKGLPLEEALAIVRPVFEALAYAHRHGIVHRRLSPDKIWMTRSQKVKLGGLEPAEPEEREEPYRAPEQEHGTLATSRADQYALGAIIYRMLTGKPPERPPKPLQEVRKKLPKRTCDAVMGMLEEKPTNRFKNVLAALAELDNQAADA